MRACQLSVKQFIEDGTNDMERRKYAETIYQWLGEAECTVDELVAISYEKSKFVLEALEKYSIETTDSNLIMHYGDAVNSLKYQFEQSLNH